VRSGLPSGLLVLCPFLIIPLVTKPPLITRLIRVCLDHPGRVMWCFLGMTACWFAALPGLRLETDGRALFNSKHPDLVFQQEVDREYGLSDFTAVGLQEEGSDSIFTPEALNWILHFSRQVQQLDGVKGDQVRSLATVALATADDQGTLHFAPPLNTEVLSSEQARTIRASVERNSLFRGALESMYGHAAAVYIPLEPGAQRERVFHQIETLAAQQVNSSEAGGHQLKTYVLGPAAAESLLGQHILSDLAVILPASMVLVGLLLWLWFRQPAIVFIGLAEVAAMEIWSLGLMSAFHKPMSLVTVVMPVVLAVFCVADTIHIGQRFNEKCKLMAHSSRRAAMDAALGEVIKPVIFASLTAFAGFLSFVFSPIPPVRDLGLFTAFGIGCDLGVSLFVIPPLLLASRFGGSDSRWAAYRGVERLLGKVTGLVAGQPLAIIFAFILATSLLGAGAVRIGVQDSWIDNFSPKSQLVAANNWFNREFYGTDVLNVLIDSGTEGGAFDPDFLQKVGRLEVELDMSSGGGGVVGLVDQLRTVARALHMSDTVPPSRDEAKQWYLKYKSATSALGFDPFVNANGSEVNLWVFVNHANYAKTAGIMNFVRMRMGAGPRIRYAGNAYRGYLLVDSITRNLRTSLLASLAMTFGLVILMLRSLKMACLAVLPVSLAVLWNFGVMGWIGVPLGVATSTFSAIALGMGVDFSLHWMARFRLARQQQMPVASLPAEAFNEGAARQQQMPVASLSAEALNEGAARHEEVADNGEPNWSEALRVTGARTGGAILLNAAVLIIGFGIMMLSSVPPNQRLGMLMCANLLTSALASLLLLPAVVAGFMKGELAGILSVFDIRESA
jgi:predicted RND superfamily exporter protein